MSEISSLTSQVQQLGDKADFWGTAVNVFIALTAFVGILYFIATLRQSTINKRLGNAQADLLQAKDHQLAIDLKDKDVKIGEANRAAGAANESAGKANERAAKLEGANIQLRNDLESAKAESRSKAAELEREQQKTAKAQEEAAKAQLALKKYVSKVAQHEAQRDVDGDKLVKELEGKPKCPVELLYNPHDGEAYWFAQSIAMWLGKGGGDPKRKGAGWDVKLLRQIPDDLGTIPNSENAPAGARFGGAFTTFGLTFLVNPNEGPEIAEHSPVSELAESLGRSTLPAMRGFSFEVERDKKVPMGSVWIVVGPRPALLSFDQE